jgi:hypothetical protein
MANNSDRFEGNRTVPLTRLEKALEPLTSYPETYLRMNQEARDLMWDGIAQMRDAGRGDYFDAPAGMLKTALGGLGYLNSPISAAVRTIAAVPFEENFGIPKDYTETAADFAMGRLGPASKARLRSPR